MQVLLVFLIAGITDSCRESVKMMEISGSDVAFCAKKTFCAKKVCQNILENLLTSSQKRRQWHALFGCHAHHILMMQQFDIIDAILRELWSHVTFLHLYYCYEAYIIRQEPNWSVLLTFSFNLFCATFRTVQSARNL